MSWLGSSCWSKFTAPLLSCKAIPIILATEGLEKARDAACTFGCCALTHSRLHWFEIKRTHGHHYRAYNREIGIREPFDERCNGDAAGKRARVAESEAASGGVALRCSLVGRRRRSGRGFRQAGCG